MSTAATLTGFTAALAVAFGGAWALGSTIGPETRASAGHGASHGAGTQNPAAAESVPPGVSLSRDGYQLDLQTPMLEAGRREVTFTVRRATGAPVVDFDVEHEKRLHLVLVRRDHEGFQHVHPTMDSAGTWRVPADLTAGSWRVFADFTPTGGSALTLGRDLLVAGDTSPSASSGPVLETEVDGYRVSVSGQLRGGADSELTLRVSRDGAPVTDLQPYLGAFGHLVALREGDLAYLHVHPNGTPGDGRTAPGPTIRFTAEVPTAGRYHLYLDFRHGGVVRTAHLVLDADTAPTTAPSSSPSAGHGDGH